jgi:thiamine-phosphate diphosphorylase
MSIPRMHLIGPLGVARPVDFLGIATRVAAGGCDAVHLRAHGFSGGDVLRLALSLRRELSAYPDTRLFINDRLDVAMLCKADGVQLGERGFEVEEARRLVGGRMVVGRSVHDIDGAVYAEKAGADFLLAGHIYDTPSKEGEPGRGLEWLAGIASAVEIPTIAIGGITADRLPEVLAAGAYGVALGRELLSADDPKAASERIRRILEQERAS